ncbi:MAG: hypothetical protein K2W95_30900 [Candidatus Obscuribacterales bacterium]|nr:hypothetical protein [Candidatus Obscuribacterales bacterium]
MTEDFDNDREEREEDDDDDGELCADNDSVSERLHKAGLTYKTDEALDAAGRILPTVKGFSLFNPSTWQLRDFLPIIIIDTNETVTLTRKK